MGGGGENAEAPSSSFPLLDPAPLFQRAVFSSAPLFPAKLLLLKGPGFPSPPPFAGRGAAGLTPLPLGLFPHPLPRRPRACTGWTLRPGVRGGGGGGGGGGLAAPCPSAPSESGLGRGRGRGGRGPGAAVQTCFLPPAAAAARAPMCGCVP